MIGIRLSTKGRIVAIFELGKLCATTGVMKNISPVDILTALFRHALGDWGELSEHDWNENDFSLVNGYRLLSSYVSSTGEAFWIITEAADEHGYREATTVLLPEEY